MLRHECAIVASMKTTLGVSLLAISLSFGSCNPETEPRSTDHAPIPAAAECVISGWPYIPKDATNVIVDIHNGDPERAIINGQAVVTLAKASIRVEPVPPLKRLPQTGRAVQLGPLGAVLTDACWRPGTADTPGHYVLTPGMVLVFDGAKPHGSSVLPP